MSIFMFVSRISELVLKTSSKQEHVVGDVSRISLLFIILLWVLMALSYRPPKILILIPQVIIIWKRNIATNKIVLFWRNAI